MAIEVKFFYKASKCGGSDFCCLMLMLDQYPDINRLDSLVNFYHSAAHSDKLFNQKLVMPVLKKWKLIWRLLHKNNK